MKTKNIRILLWSLVALWMAFIFFLSAQSGSESSGLSKKIIESIVKFLNKDFINMPPEQQASIVLNLQFIARKTAHFLAYTILGVLCMCALQKHPQKNKARFLSAVLLCAVYAASDELHQLFVPGRSAQVADVGIDTLGALFGISLVCLMVYASAKRRRKRENAV
ncbi:MAG: VanZ family protein [Christensenellales bacterium]